MRSKRASPNNREWRAQCCQAAIVSLALLQLTSSSHWNMKIVQLLSGSSERVECRWHNRYTPRQCLNLGTEHNEIDQSMAGLEETSTIQIYTHLRFIDSNSPNKPVNVWQYLYFWWHEDVIESPMAEVRPRAPRHVTRVRPLLSSKTGGLKLFPSMWLQKSGRHFFGNTFHDIEENSDKIEINCLIYLTFAGLHLRKFECVPTSTNMFHVLMLIIDKLNVLLYSYLHFVTWLISGKWNNSIMHIRSGAKNKS